MARGKMVYVKAKPKTKAGVTGHWSEKKKHEAVCLWSTGMSMAQVSIELGVPYETIKQWRTTAWWKDIHEELKTEDKQHLDAKLTKILNKTLESVMDRLENGEFVYDQISGTLKRSPVKLRDATTAMNSVIDKRQLIRKEPTKITEQSNAAVQLASLAQQFASFVNNNTKQEKVINFVDGETVEQNDDGTYSIKE